jgi:hypothetical protein
MDKLTHQRMLVEQDREDLGRTVNALAAKVDVQARARHALSSARTKMRSRAGTEAMVIATSTAAALLALISVAIWWRRR